MVAVGSTHPGVAVFQAVAAGHLMKVVITMVSAWPFNEFFFSSITMLLDWSSRFMPKQNFGTHNAPRITSLYARIILVNEWTSRQVDELFVGMK